MRLFVAVDFDATARARIAEVQSRLGRSGSLRWVKPDQLHLTLVFLGEVEDGRVPAVIESYARPVAIAPFDMELHGLGTFPPRGAPRALWVGVREGHGEMIELQRALAERAHALRIAIEARPFSPHLTLARWRESRPADRGRVLESGEADSIARVRVSRATLYHSRLSPAGPTYSVLAHATLTSPK